MQLYIFCAALWLGIMTLAVEATWQPQFANADPKIVQWYGTRQNKAGEFCCDQSDGHDFYGNYTLNADGSIDVEGYHLKAFMVLDGANPTGHAVSWYVEAQGKRFTYCFAPGPGG
jgi:hypothetical protein